MATERYVRWQTARAAQFGVTIALFLTFAAASLGFSLSLLTKTDFAPTGACVKLAFASSLILLSLSLLVGGTATVSRLLDFRKTAKLVRAKDQADSVERIAELRDGVRRQERTTWCLFWIQIALFGIGVSAW